jgi:hypothetical protein
MNITQIEDEIQKISTHIRPAKKYIELAKAANSVGDKLIAKALVKAGKHAKLGFHQSVANILNQVKNVLQARNKRRQSQARVVTKRRLLTLKQLKNEHRNKLLRDLRLRKKNAKKFKRPKLNNFMLDYIEQIKHKSVPLLKFLYNMYQKGFRYAAATRKWYKV